MNRGSLLSFSRRAAESRQALFGEIALWKGNEISCVVAPLTSMELAAGGFEKSGTMRALVSSSYAVALFDQIQIRGRKYKVTETKTNAGSAETSLVIEPLNSL